MESGVETILFAALVTVLISFPTVSQGIDYSSGSQTKSPIVSTSTDIDTSIDVEQSDPSTVTVEKYNMIYTVSETPSRRIEQLKTPEATFEMKKSNRSYISVVSSPYGTYRKGIVNGRKVSRFKGVNRSKLREQMKDLREEISSYRSLARQKMLPDVEVRVIRSKASEDTEQVKIDNDGSQTINLAGWKLRNSDGDTYRFEELKIPAHGSAKIYTGEAAELNVTEDNQAVYLYGTGVDWDSDSEKALLFNVEGLKIDQDTY